MAPRRLLPKFRYLEFFEEVARRAGDIHSARSTALAVLDTLDDAGGFGALGTIRALVGIHDLLTVAGLGNFRHNADLPGTNVAAHAGLIEQLSPKWACRIESSGTSRQDYPGDFSTAGIGWRRTAIEALL